VPAIAHVVIAMEVAVDHPFDGLVGYLADAIEEVAALARVRARVDQEHALIGDKKDRIRPAEVEEEIDVVRYPFDGRFLG
jgi:hypothetical protein